MGKQMLQFRYVDGEPDIENVAKMLGVDPGEIDSEFGIIATDPDAGLYTVLISEEAAAKADAALKKKGDADPAEGLFGNVKISPFEMGDD